MFWRTDKKVTDEQEKEIERPYIVLPSANNYRGYNRPEFCIISVNENECEIHKEFSQKADEILTFIGYDKVNDHIHFMKH